MQKWTIEIKNRTIERSPYLSHEKIYREVKTEVIQTAGKPILTHIRKSWHQMRGKEIRQAAWKYGL